MYRCIHQFHWCIAPRHGQRCSKKYHRIEILRYTNTECSGIEILRYICCSIWVVQRYFCEKAADVYENTGTEKSQLQLSFLIRIRN